eukprot:10242118-Alexandrium_andersonii.AAC.1
MRNDSDGRMRLREGLQRRTQPRTTRCRILHSDWYARFCSNLQDNERAPQEHYGPLRQQQAGQSFAEVLRAAQRGPARD